jgi:hypothetical protein
MHDVSIGVVLRCDVVYAGAVGYQQRENAGDEAAIVQLEGKAEQQQTLWRRRDGLRGRENDSGWRGCVASVHSPCSSSAPKSDALMMQANTLQDMSADMAAWRSPPLKREKPAHATSVLMKRNRAMMTGGRGGGGGAPQLHEKPREERYSSSCWPIP